MNKEEQNRNGEGNPSGSQIPSSSATNAQVQASGGYEQQKKMDLDPSFLEGCASLLDQIDKRVIVLLRDQKTLIGTLVSIDQFNNLVLQGTVERVYYKKGYGDIPRGTFIVRGDTVVLVGEIDQHKETTTLLAQVPIESILEAKRDDAEAKKVIEAKRERAFKDRGMAYVKDTGLEEF